MANRKISDLTALTTPASGDYLPIVDISEAASADKNKRITVGELLRGVPDGTPVAPGIAFENNPNTGLFRSGDNQISIVTNSNERLVVDSSGNVGVNTASPASTLDVNGDITITDKIIHGGDTNTAIRFPANDTVSIETAGTDRLRITSDGKVGIGTTSPEEQFHVKDGNARIEGAASTDAILQIRGAQTTGSATDAVLLFVSYANNASYGSNAEIRTTNQGNGVGQLVFSNRRSSGGGNEEAARIDGSGRLLVGTSSVSNSIVTFAIQGSPASATNGPVFLLKINQATPGDGASLGGVGWSDNTDTVSLAITGRRDGGTWSASSKPSRLEFSTTADGSSSPTERLRITSDGKVGINTTSPASTLDVNGDITITDKIIHGGNTNTAIRFPANDTVSIETAGFERARITSSGQLLVGRTFSLVQDYRYSTQIYKFGSNPLDSGTLGLYFNAVEGSAGSRATALGFYKQVNSGIVRNNDGLGVLRFNGYNGSAYNEAATIEAQVDGTPGANDMPGRLVFSTTADGSSSPTERMMITSNGTVRLLNSPGIDFSGIQTNAAGMTSETLDSYEEGTWTPFVGSNAGNDTSITPSNRSGTYVKIGNRVFAFFKISVNCSSYVSVAGPMTLRGLPFTPSSNESSAGHITRSSGASTNVAGLQYAGGTSYGNYPHFRIYPYASLTAIDYATIFPTTGVTYTIEGTITFTV